VTSPLNGLTCRSFALGGAAFFRKCLETIWAQASKTIEIGYAMLQQKQSLLPLLPTRFLLTVEFVLYLALNGQYRPVKLKEAISAKSFSPRHLEPTIQHLVRLGILKSIKGSKGGYVLGHPSEAISLANLYSASIGRPAKRFGVDETLPHQIVNLVLAEVQSKWAADLAKISIRDLVVRSRLSPLSVVEQMNRRDQDEEGH
jgi:Rrf2 family transcriptional regulator, iron-sulfur cluster assembly transcription factor